MVSSIRKRDARIVPFDVNKIAQAIFRAASSQGGKDYVLSLKIAAEVLERLNEQFEDAIPDVEQVQDLVEKTLIKSGHARTAKAYILYRHQRTKIREMNTRLMTTIRDLTFKDAKDNDLKRENANIDGDTAMGMMLRYGSESSKQFYEMYILNPKHSLAHKNGDIHIHDLDFLSLTTTCCQIDIKTLFKGGFGTGHGFLREPNDIRSYSALACIAIQANQNDQHGGQSIPNFEYGLAPGVAKTFIKELCLILDLYNMESKDAVKAGLRAYIEENESILDEKGLAFVREILTQHAPALNIDFAVKKALEYTEKATYQAMEALVHNLNTMHSRAGAQIPFSSGAGVHGVEVVHQRFHRLIRGLLGVLKGLLDGEVDVQGGGVLSEDLPDEGKALFIEDGFVFLNVGAQPGLYSILALHIVEIKDQAQFLDEGLGDSGGEAVFEIRDALPAVLVVLIGLNGDAGKGAVAADIVGFAQEAVARAEAALEQRLDVDLAAGGGQAQEIKVVDVDVAVLVREAVLRVEDVHLVELLGTFAAVTQHHAHSGVAVDVGVLALEIVVLGVLEGEVADGGHEPGVHFPDLGPLVAVQDVRLGGAGMAALDKGFFYQILHLFHIGDGVLELLIEALQHFGGYLERKDIILPSLTAGGTEDCLSDLVHVKRNNACVTFPDRTNHSSSHSL